MVVPQSLRSLAALPDHPAVSDRMFEL